MINKLKKLFRISLSSTYIIALFKGTAASVEQSNFLKSYSWNTIIDVGANRGQFSLVARNCHPQARIYSFEPLEKPARIFKTVFKNDKKTMLYPFAIGPIKQTTKMHLSYRDDSSSLLPITDTQNRLFPGTAECGVLKINIMPLTEILSIKDISKPALLKLDVQGFELEALKGCELLLAEFNHIYVECSFVELYEGQALVHEIIDFLKSKNFHMIGIYNVSYGNDGIAIQADFLFLNTEN